MFGEDNDKDRYLITYADLITLLLGLFIILYAISKVDVKKYDNMMSIMGNVFGSRSGKIVGLEKSSLQGSELPTTTLGDKLANVIKDLHYENSIRLEQNERGIIIHILDDILFPSGSANLHEKALPVLAKISDIIKGLPNDIRIEGHTDNVPIKTKEFPSNWHLSVQRALNTAFFLIDKENLPQDKISIVGYSEYKPIAPNTTAEGRAANRRVDIVIIKK